MTARAKITIGGMVQGVGYRYFAQRSATTLGLAGHAKNLATGDVEVQAQGERGLVEEFIKQLRIGPRHAHVDHVKVEWVDVDPQLNGFYTD